MPLVRVAVVAGSALLRAGLEALLAAAPALAVVGVVDASHVDDDATLAELVAPLAPAVVVWAPDDAVDADPDWLALLGDDGGRGGAAVVLLADLHGADSVATALRAGVRAVLARDAASDEIVAAIEAAAAGLVALPSELIADLLAREVPAPSETAPLTAREREVLALIARGMANKAIAPRLGISEHTVKAHVASIFEKLGAGTRAEAVMIGARLGVVML